MSLKLKNVGFESVFDMKLQAWRKIWGRLKFIWIILIMCCPSPKNRLELNQNMFPVFLSINRTLKILEKNQNHAWNPYENIYIWGYKKFQKKFGRERRISNLHLSSTYIMPSKYFWHYYNQVKAHWKVPSSVFYGWQN